MARDPDTLPDSEDPSGPCPRCGRTSNFTNSGSLPVAFVQVGYEPELVERVTVLQCQGCLQGLVVVEEEWQGDQTTRRVEELRRRGITSQISPRAEWHGLHWWPPPGTADLDEAIPEATRSTYAEAMRCLSSKAYRAAVVMLRRTLDTIVHDKGSEAAQQANTLYDALRIMAEEHAIDPNLAAWAKEIRLAGNVGAHYDPADDVTKEEAENLQHLTRRLLEYVYEMPARIRRTRPASE